MDGGRCTFLSCVHCVVYVMHTHADTCDGLEADIAMRENELDSSLHLGQGSYASQSSLGANGNMIAGSSKTLQPHHLNRPTDFVHRTRDAGVYMVMFR